MRMVFFLQLYIVSSHCMLYRGFLDSSWNGLGLRDFIWNAWSFLFGSDHVTIGAGLVGFDRVKSGLNGLYSDIYFWTLDGSVYS